MASEGPARVIIAGYYGSGNAGDEAILAGILTILSRQYPGLDVIVVSADPASTAAAHPVAAVSKTDKPAVIAAIRDSGLVILGGGGLLHDHWPMDLGNLFSDPASHISYPAYAALAALFDKPLLLCALGVGPLTTAAGRRYTRLTCDQAQRIIVRDRHSKTLLEELGVDPERVEVTADPAFLLTASPASLDLEPPIVGVALREWAGAWEGELANALDELLARRGGSVLFLPFERSSDTVVADRVRARMKIQDRTRVSAAAGDPVELARLIGGCHAVVGMRYHSVLFAIRQCVPVLGLAYDPKIEHLLETARAAEYTVDLSAVRAPELTARIESVLDDSGLRDRLRLAAEDLAVRAAKLDFTCSRAPAPHVTIRAWLDELTAAAPGDPEIRTAITRRRAALGCFAPYDIVCFPGIEWDFRWMRPQQLLSQFADRGHRVFFLSAANVGASVKTRPLRDGIWEVQLSAPTPLDVYSGFMSEEFQRATVTGLTALARDFGVERAVSMLHLATWTPAALELRRQLGWPLVYDCMDDWSGFAWMPDAMLDRERELVRQADLVVVTARKLWDKWSPRNPHTILARNAADVAHFRRPEQVHAAIDLPSSRVIIGFFGTIDSWFDLNLIEFAATARPQYFFALLGSVYDAPVERLDGLPNVRLFGPRPYAELPAWLERFDVCIIPFKINPVTEATDPVKFYEYLAQGKPVVATRLPELERYRELLYLVGSPDEFVHALDAAAAERDSPLRDRRLAAADENTWTARYEIIHAAIQHRRRILFACPVLILGGVEVILKNRILELQRRGWLVRLAAMEEGGGRPLFEAGGIELHVCPDEPAFVRELTEFQPEWVVSIDTPAALAAARQAPQIGVVYEVHSTYPHILAPLADRGFWKGVRGVIVPSPSQEQLLRALLPEELPIEIVPNALSPEYLEDRAPKEPPAKAIVLWVGRLDSIKNWRAFLELATRLSDRTGAEFHLMSAGPRTENDSAEIERVSAALEGRLHWMREVDHARMPDIYRAAAASGGCMVSTSTAESFGMAILEAMACGCPVVAPDIEGLRDLVRHGETGLLYPPGDIVAACEQVLAALHHEPHTRQRMMVMAREFARQFQPAAAADRFVAALEKWSAGAAGPQEKSPPLPDISHARRVVLFPPSLPWRAGGRPRRWARAFASLGCVVIYSDPEHVGGFTEIEERVFVANVPLQALPPIPNPVFVIYSYNLDAVASNAGGDAQAIFEYLAPREIPTALEEEWLARAAVVTVPSEEARQTVSVWRPDAIVVPDAGAWDQAALEILDTLEKPPLWENDLSRLKALLRCRENQVARLEAQIRERDRPAIDILHAAVTEQKRILSERDKGISFLRGELAHRDRLIAALEENIASYQNHLAAALEERRGQEQEITSLRQDIASFETAFAAREEGIQFLRHEVETRDAIVRARDEAIEFLRQEIAARDHMIAKLTQSLRELEAMPIWRRIRKR